ANSFLFVRQKFYSSQMISVIREKVFRSEFARNLFFLISATALSQALPFLVLPFLQRYFFSPNEFGLLAVYMAFSELIISVASLKYEYAIVTEPRLKNAVNLLMLSLLCVIAVSILCALVLWALDLSGFKSTAMEALHGLIYLVPVSAAAYGSFE